MHSRHHCTEGHVVDTADFAACLILFRLQQHLVQVTEQVGGRKDTRNLGEKEMQVKLGQLAHGWQLAAHTYISTCKQCS